jgi:uncharacterized protein (TIGR03663 family)
MHADEANQAVKAGLLLEGGPYAYDPADHHGPVLYYAVLPLAWIRGQRTLAELDEVTVRLVPALAGAASALLAALLAAPLGRRTALVAGAFAAAAPVSVYYSRFFIQETLLVLFTLCAFVAARRWWALGRLRWALAAGVSAGLMQATKESAPLFLGAGLLALLAAPSSLGRPRAARPWRDAAAGLAAALGVAALFYSSFGKNPRGLWDAVAAYGAIAGRLAAASTGHEKPWDYYVRLLTWEGSGGLVFQEAGLVVLALLGVVAALRSRRPLLLWAAAYGAVVLLVLSAVPYKTPWIAVNLVPPLALLAAGALEPACRSARGRLLSCGAGLAVLALLGYQADLACRRYPADERNPFAYVHSSPDVLKVRALAEAARAARPGLPIRVVSEEVWPLPWYLRGVPGVGYWSRPPADCDGALVIASAGEEDAVASRLHGGYARSYLGLRPGFVLVAFTPRP